jgi:hypothetical protein
MLNCVVKPGTVVTVGIANALLQVFVGAVNTGAVGKMTILTVLLGAEHADIVPSENSPAGT